MTISPRYRRIVEHYEACLERHGDNHLGVDWPNPEDVEVRHRVMLDVIRPVPAGATVSLLDFGCGASHLYEHLRRDGRTDVDYAGLDLSPRFDYAVLNGVFTEKLDLSFEEMLDFWQRMVTAVFGLVTRGIAFNVMSKHVDWEREDLFHLPLDTLGAFLTSSVSRNFVVRNDYGLYEYTTYVYR